MQIKTVRHPLYFVLRVAASGSRSTNAAILTSEFARSGFEITRAPGAFRGAGKS